MNAFNPADLAQFTGTERYYRLNRKCLLTDGTKYLAEAAGAFWLMDAAASYLIELGTDDWFVQVVLVVTASKAVLTLVKATCWPSSSCPIPPKWAATPTPPTGCSTSPSKWTALPLLSGISVLSRFVRCCKVRPITGPMPSGLRWD